MGTTEDILELLKIYAPKYNINIAVIPAIMAQYHLESKQGTSNKVRKIDANGHVYNRHNYFGLKYSSSQPNRCPSACGYFTEYGFEEDYTGKRTPDMLMTWWEFTSMEACVKGYFDFLFNSKWADYSKITSAKTPEEYITILKNAGYASDANYISKIMSVVNTYYADILNKEETNSEGGKKGMRISLHAGHNPDGKVACGAVSLLKESTENRKVVAEVKAMLEAAGNTVFDDTVNDGTSVSDIINKIVKKCNSHDVDLVVSIHFNSGAKDVNGNNKSTGTEVLVYNLNGKAVPYAKATAAAIAELGYTNRGVKQRTDLGVLRKTNAPAMLVECCFVDDYDDVKLYSSKDMAKAIYKGIMGTAFVETSTPATNTGSTSTSTSSSNLYRVQVGAYKVKTNADKTLEKLKGDGFTGFVKQVGSLYKVQVGAFRLKSNADDLAKRLRAKKYSTVVVYE